MEDIHASALQLCSVILRETEVYQETRDLGVFESMSRHFELFYSHLLMSPETTESMLTFVGEIIGQIRNILNDADSTGITQDAVGRPRFNIAQEQLEYLLELRFTCPEIARLLGVSLRTIRRRMEEFGIAVRNRYSSMSDMELDEEVTAIKHHYPNAGVNLTSGVCIYVRFLIRIDLLQRARVLRHVYVACMLHYSHSK